MAKPRYIKGKDGKMEGSIGAGKTDVPTAGGPATTPNMFDDLPGANRAASYNEIYQRYLAETGKPARDLMDFPIRFPDMQPVGPSTKAENLLRGLHLETTVQAQFHDLFHLMNDEDQYHPPLPDENPASDAALARAEAEHDELIAEVNTRVDELIAEELEEQRWARSYHATFTEQPDAAVTATKTLISSRLSTLTVDAQQTLMKTWLAETAAVYGATAPNLVFTDLSAPDSGLFHSGLYSVETNTIYLHAGRPSIVTLLYTTREAFRHSGHAEAAASDSGEHDARAWALSLYHRAAPKTLKKLVTDRRIPWADPAGYSDN